MTKATVWQFDALDLRPVARWLAARRALSQQKVGPAAPSLGGSAGYPTVTFEPRDPYDSKDTFLDTRDWRFYRAGLSVCVHSLAGKHYAELAWLQAGSNARGKRGKLETPLENGGLKALTQAPGRAGEWISSLAGRQAPTVLFHLKAHCQPYVVTLDGQSAGEVTLEETRVERPAGGEATRLRRVGIRMAPKAADRLQPFFDDLRRACRLTPSVATKFEAGLMTLDLAPAGIPDVGSLNLIPDPSMSQLAYAVLRRAFLSMLQNEAGTRIGEDPEALHDMRVGIRRLRAAMGLFAPALPARMRTARSELRWIARRLGQVRDLDIQLERLTMWQDVAKGAEIRSLDLLVSTVTERRQRARLGMLKALDTRRYERLVSRMEKMLYQGPPRRSPAARVPALAAFPGLIRQRQASAFAAGESLDLGSAPEAYHRLRIRLKRLRYAVENARDLYGPPASDYVAVLTRLQDLLGEHQDAYVAIRQIHSLLGSGQRRLPFETVFMMGRISERYQQAAVRLRKRYRKVFQPIVGKNWSRLEKAMDKGLANRGSLTWPPPPKPPPALKPPQPSKEP